MTQTSPVPVAPQGTSPTPRERRRAALRDLIQLATECAATEAEIENRYRTSVEQENKSFERSLKNLEYRFASLRESVTKKRQERLEQIESQVQADREEIDAASRQQRRQHQDQYESIRTDIQQKVNKEVWLADSLLEGVQAQVRAEQAKVQQELDANLELLEAQQSQAMALLALYHHTPPPPPQEPEEPEKIAGDVEAIFQERRSLVESRLDRLNHLTVPRMFVGVRPALIVAVVFIVTGLAAHVSASGGNLSAIWETPPVWRSIGIAVAWAAGACVLAGIVLWFVGQRQVRRAYVPLVDAMMSTRRAAEARMRVAYQRLEQRYRQAVQNRDSEVRSIKEKYAPALARAKHDYEEALANVARDTEQRLSRLETRHQRAITEADDWEKQHQDDLRQRFERETSTLRQRHEEQLAEFRRAYDESRVALERRLKDGLEQIRAPIGRINDDSQVIDWNDQAWRSWQPPRDFCQEVRFGELTVDLRRLAAGVAKSADAPPLRLDLPEAFSMPVTLGFPRNASVLIQSDRELRPQALRTLQTVMARLLTCLPPGRVRFTLVDPVGLGQNFAGFMHLADHDEALVGGRIWTENEHIERRLADLTEHMETVIQKYLRNEYETIDDYNAQAGELAEPYRFLVIADFPVGFTSDAFRRLASICASGARCGVYVLIHRDTRQSLPSEAPLDELEAHAVNIVQKNSQFTLRDDVFGQFPLRLDDPPPEEALTDILDAVGRQAKEAKRVEVPFQAIAPPNGQFWSASAQDDLQVPIGRMGATRLQTLRLGRGVAQHALVAGKTGSGKSTLLHVLITNLAMWYSPDEVEFYLVDFKKGVEFKTYATHALPHARAIAVESDREFGLSVLQRLDAELTRRGELFRQAGVQDLPSYRQTPGAPKLPRTLLIIDEFQEFFSEDDKLAQDAAVLLDRLVRQGRAFGIHVLLGSQTIGGTSGLARSTIGQMAVRIALQTSEADSQLILGDNNSAARLLSRPGEAIYNDAGGLVEANSPFQISWLPDEEREKYLQLVQQRSASLAGPRPEPIVFEGNAPADIRKNRRLIALLSSGEDPAVSSAPQAFLGEPVAIKDPTAVSFRRQSGANLLVIGQAQDSALAILVSSILSLAAQHPRDAAVFYLFDGSPADSPLAGTLERIASLLPHRSHVVPWRQTADAMVELADELSRRQSGDEQADASIYVVFYGLQRYRVLRRQEESFSFSVDDEEKKPQPDKLFADLLREGPPVGIHLLTWIDTPMAVERTFDRNALREFDHRVLFQMSATDSSNLIDSPAANKLGFYRALAYSEEQGTLEKFRPYAMPDDEFLQRVAQWLAKRGA